MTSAYDSARDAHVAWAAERALATAAGIAAGARMPGRYATEGERAARCAMDQALAAWRATPAT